MEVGGGGVEVGGGGAGGRLVITRLKHACLSEESAEDEVCSLKNSLTCKLKSAIRHLYQPWVRSFSYPFPAPFAGSGTLAGAEATQWADIKKLGNLLDSLVSSITSYVVSRY